LLRVKTLIQRLCNLKIKDRKRNSWNRKPITAPELIEVETIWFRVFQWLNLPEELSYLQAKKKS
jgi:hypothetical protein